MNFKFMENISIETLIHSAEASEGMPLEIALRLLDPVGSDLFICLQAAYSLRQKYFGKDVTIHILNNVQNGLCPEDCRYCAQSRTSKASIAQYPMKSDNEILQEARAAYAQGAHRYCMVFSGTGPTDTRIEKLTSLIGLIKNNVKIEVCVSPGAINAQQAAQLKAAGLDRLNHNLNTAETYYSSICSTHSYYDRLQTLMAAKSAGLAICSGVIIGMGESPVDVYSMAKQLGAVGANSIPVNFFMPIEGTSIKEAVGLTPEYCLRILCLFRLMNPKAELRMAAGREMHLRSLEVMGLYPANSLFLQGYLNTHGDSDWRTLNMIKDAGFSIVSEVSLDSLLVEKQSCSNEYLKTRQQLRPFKQENEG